MDILEQYRVMHKQGWFPGGAIRPHVTEIRELVLQHGAKTLLDYGCGKAEQYLKYGWHKSLDLETVYLYDPGAGVSGVSNVKPAGTFDAVICTDVLEHVENPEQVIAELVGYARKFLFCSISCKPSKPHKRLLDGRPVHITLHPPEWWMAQFEDCAVPFYLRFDV